MPGSLALAMTLMLVGALPAQADEPAPASHTLLESGYGYVLGDIVELAPATGPLAVGDIVVFDLARNASSCGVFGPGEALAKIIALPGDLFQLIDDGLRVRDEDIRVPNLRPPIIVGQATYGSIPSGGLAVPPGEYLVDTMAGMECTGRSDEDGMAGGPVFGRVTVRQGAILGRVVRKVGFDEWTATSLEGAVY